jgi:hypothetical protein
MVLNIYEYSKLGIVKIYRTHEKNIDSYLCNHNINNSYRNIIY